MLHAVCTCNRIVRTCTTTHVPFLCPLPPVPSLTWIAICVLKKRDASSNLCLPNSMQQELCIKPKSWKDLLTDEPFTRKDIIHLQDPLNLQVRVLGGLGACMCPALYTDTLLPAGQGTRCCPPLRIIVGACGALAGVLGACGRRLCLFSAPRLGRACAFNHCTMPHTWHDAAQGEAVERFDQV